MLTQNLDTGLGLTNGVTGIVWDIIPKEGVDPPGLQVPIVVKFDHYKG